MVTALTAARFIGTMRSATIKVCWRDDAAERAFAHAIFGTPLDTRTWFTEPKGFWWGVLRVFFPHANPLHVWLFSEEWH
jgi:hypothetical protein